MNSYDEYLRLSKFVRNLSYAKSDNDSGEHIAKQIVERDKQYTELLKSYTTITRVRLYLKEIHKWLFFWMVVVACCFCLSLAYRLVRRILAVEDPQFILDSVAVIFAAFTAFVSTVIAVPMAITKFLFNTKEDDNITQLINHTQEHDAAGIDKLKDKFSQKLPGKAGGNKPNDKSPIEELYSD